ncbi:MAG: efflux RND transporter periplasmic adaptor subunit [Candidatus Kryptoniota bacterium]
MKSQKLVLIIAGSILFVGAIVVFRLHVEASANEASSESKAISVSVARAVYGSIVNRIEATGALEGVHETEIISETSGKIIKINAEVDNNLSVNSSIAVVENNLQEITLEQARAQVAAAQVNSDKADADFKRIQNLFSQKAVSETQLENAEVGAKAAVAQLRAAQASQKLAQKNYDDTFLKTPIAGRLAQKFVTIGQMITPGTKVASVVDDSRMKLKVGVSEADISLVKPGNMVQVTSEAVPNLVFTGVVKTVALKADAQTRTFQVEIELPNDRVRSLKSGMFARAEIMTSGVNKSLVIPSAALIELAGNSPTVFIANNSAASLRGVSVGMRSDSLVEIRSGLSLMDTVVTFGQQNLKDGSKVKVF